MYGARQDSNCSSDPNLIRKVRKFLNSSHLSEEEWKTRDLLSNTVGKLKSWKDCWCLVLSVLGTDVRNAMQNNVSPSRVREERGKESLE